MAGARLPRSNEPVESSKSNAVNLVHRGEVAHVLQKHRGLYDMAQLASRRFDDAFHIFQRALRLRLDVSSNKLVGLRIDGNLSGNEEKSVYLDGLRIRPDRFWTAIRQNNFSHGMVSLELMTIEAEASS